MTGDVHVMPLEGRKHEASTQCWCHPKLDPGHVVIGKSPKVWIHHLAN